MELSSLDYKKEALSILLMQQEMVTLYITSGVNSTSTSLLSIPVPTIYEIAKTIIPPEDNLFFDIEAQTSYYLADEADGAVLTDGDGAPIIITV